MAATTPLIEDYIPYIKFHGLNTSKNATFGGTITVDGGVTLGSTLSVTGATTLSGAVTQKANVVSGSGATVTLTAAQSGSVVLFDRAAGIVFTLPSPAVGMYFDFITTVSVTSNAAKVITNTGTVLLIGSLMNIDTDTSNAVAAWTGNGSNHIAISSNGTTTGGLIGSFYRLTCVSTTLWQVVGQIQGSGVVATPFATS